MERLIASEQARQLLAELTVEYGELILYQGGGCCEGSAPLCVKKERYRLRNGDVNIGQISGVPYWIEGAMFDYWKNVQFEIHVQDGIGGNEYSLERLKNKAFVVVNRLFTADEISQLADVTLYTR